jgi:LuxR family maltose regulon positive regulatory protein
MTDSARLIPHEGEWPASAPRPEPLARPALLEWLDRAFGVRLTTVTAGAGFGKSTLLETWVADLRCAWHSVTSRDRAVDSLADGVTAALVRALPELVAGLPVAALGPADAAGAETWSAAVCERLHAGLTHDLVLVLDDVHEIGATEGPARLIECLCLEAPDTLHAIGATDVISG